MPLNIPYKLDRGTLVFRTRISEGRSTYLLAQRDGISTLTARELCSWVIPESLVFFGSLTPLEAKLFNLSSRLGAMASPA